MNNGFGPSVAVMRIAGSEGDNLRIARICHRGGDKNRFRRSVHAQICQRYRQFSVFNGCGYGQIRNRESPADNFAAAAGHAQCRCTHVVLHHIEYVIGRRADAVLAAAEKQRVQIVYQLCHSTDHDFFRMIVEQIQRDGAYSRIAERGLLFKEILYHVRIVRCRINAVLAHVRAGTASAGMPASPFVQ